jgi:hypothetical protein
MAGSDSSLGSILAPTDDWHGRHLRKIMPFRYKYSNDYYTEA